MSEWSANWTGNTEEASGSNSALGPFSRKSGPGNFSGPESCFVFAVVTFKIKVSVVLKMIL